MICCSLNTHMPVLFFSLFPFVQSLHSPRQQAKVKLPRRKRRSKTKSTHDEGSTTPDDLGQLLLMYEILDHHPVFYVDCAFRAHQEGIIDCRQYSKCRRLGRPTFGPDLPGRKVRYQDIFMNPPHLIAPISNLKFRGPACGPRRFPRITETMLIDDFPESLRNNAD